MIDPHRYTLLQSSLDCCDSPDPCVYPDSNIPGEMPDSDEFVDALTDNSEVGLQGESREEIKEALSNFNTIRYYAGRCQGCDELFKIILSDDIGSFRQRLFYCTECLGAGELDPGVFSPTDCPHCGGSGWKHSQLAVRIKKTLSCTECGGTGEQIVMWDLEHEYDCPKCSGYKLRVAEWIVNLQARLSCSRCNGRGRKQHITHETNDETCPSCRGRGWSLQSILGADTATHT